MESSPLLSAPEHAQNLSGSKAAAMMLTDVRTLREMMARFKAIQVDPAEFACLKAIVLFKPGTAESLFTVTSRVTSPRQCVHFGSVPISFEHCKE